jgi:MFS family permease
MEVGGHDIEWAGVALSGFAVAAIAGGVIYGLRRWPGGYGTHCLLSLLSTCVFVAVSALSGSRFGLAGILVPLAGAGFCQACVVTARNLSLHQSLPARYRSTGNSLLYSASCTGFGLSSAFAGWFADHGAIIAFVLVSCAIAGALALISAVTEIGRTRITQRGRSGCCSSPARALTEEPRNSSS